MKRKNIFLDFTSLLDVTLIIIFFFVIFSHLDGEENKAKTEEKVSELEQSIFEADERESEAADLKELLEKEIDIVKDSDERRGSDNEAILEYLQGKNVKIILDMKDDDWSVRILHNKEVLHEINSDENVGAKLIKVMVDSGYDKKDTIFCDFVFDGSIPGTASAYRTIKKGLNEVLSEYKYIYLSETDLSTGD